MIFFSVQKEGSAIGEDTDGQLTGDGGGEE
jgi:hypothetical protein